MFIATALQKVFAALFYFFAHTWQSPTFLKPFVVLWQRYLHSGKKWVTLILPIPMRNSITILVSLLFCLLHLQAFSQTPISGVVNSYYKVTQVDKPGNNVTVVNASGLAPLDKVMLIQMKGAKIEERDISSFGTITNLNFAGNYELATVCRVEGNNIYFINSITSNYEVADKVQLVEIPKYNSVSVVAPLEAKPWDNTLGVGGVLAISVSNTLTLDADINASEKGFKGGVFLKSVNEPQFCYFFERAGYVYDPTIVNPQKGAYKGESIADIPVSISGGRAAAANGGGGGNNHNNGGGGGSNLTSGGIGGGNASTSGCPGSYQGEGGKALQNNSNTKIYLGGGGGAGHANNDYPVIGGGNGGGIIYIEAGSIKTNGKKIIANGGEGSYTIGDGASGGGGGGTIILNVNSYLDQPVIEARGGKGGDEEENENLSGRCFGEGGGGSGGVIYFSGAQPLGTVTVAGGAKGSRLNTQCTTGYLASAGDVGKVIPNFPITQSTFISSSCPEAKTLPVNLVSFNAQLQKNKVALEWQVTNGQDADQYIIQRKTTGEEWKDITTVRADAQTSKYQAIDAAIAHGAYMYQLKIIEKSGATLLSPVRYILYSADADRLIIYPNPVTGAQEITIQHKFKIGDVVKIFDAIGKLLIQKRIIKDEVSININLSSLQKGMYMIQTANASGRLIIQ